MAVSPDAAAVRPRPRPIVGLFVVGASLTVWWPAFVLGAWHTLFFDQMLVIWVASVAALIVLWLQPRPTRGRLWRSLVLLVPSLWLVLGFLPIAEDAPGIVLATITVTVALVGLPFSLWVLVRIIWPNVGEDIPRRSVVVAFAAIALIAVASFVLGATNPLFLHCSDFELAGMSLPPGCAP